MKYLGNQSNLTIDFADYNYGIFIVVTSYEIFVITRYTDSVAANKITTSDYRPTTAKVNGLKVNFTVTGGNVTFGLFGVSA